MAPKSPSLCLKYHQHMSIKIKYFHFEVGSCSKVWQHIQACLATFLQSRKSSYWCWLYEWDISNSHKLFSRIYSNVAFVLPLASSFRSLESPSHISQSDKIDSSSSRCVLVPKFFFGRSSCKVLKSLWYNTFHLVLSILKRSTVTL